MNSFMNCLIINISEKKVSRLAARQLLATRFYLKINRSVPDQCGIHHNERNHAAFTDVKRIGKEEYSGRDSDNELSEFQ